MAPETAPSTPSGSDGRSTGTAVFTMARNESVFLPIWVAYCRRFFPAECVHVFDHLGTDGSAEAVRDRHGCVLHRENHPAYDDFDWYTRRIEALQAELLTRYRVVIFAESDEIIWHPAGLSTYADAFDAPAARCTGYQLWHDRETEAPIDLTEPILHQRSRWFRRPNFDKPTVVTRPVRYQHGFHDAEGSFARDDELLLLHLHTMDVGVARAKKLRISAYTDYNESTRSRDLGRHNRLDAIEFETWWQDLADEYRIEPIPDSLRRSIPI